MDHKFWVPFLAGLIFLAALGIRSFAFFIPHWQGDEGLYVTLAMKYDSLGLPGLNLEKAQIRQAVLPENPAWRFAFPECCRAPPSSGC